MKKIILTGIILSAVVLITGCTVPKKTTGIGTEAAKLKVEQFIKDGGGNATVKEVTEEGDLYKVVIDANNQDMITYVSKDGTKFFPQAIDFAEAQKQIEEARKQEEEANKEIPKTDRPAVDLYVMSFCPYGNKAEDTLQPVYNLLKNKADFNFYYIVTADGDKVTSLHGQPEVDQNEREACVLKNDGKDKWMSFVTYINANCGSDGSCWEKGAQSLGIDTAKVTSCVASQGTSLMKADAEASNAAGASGSPTMRINGVQTKTVYQYGNSEEYKKVICGAFNTAPAECSQELSSTTSTAESGSCGS